MTRPDLSDPDVRYEYRRELRVYLRPWRMAGLFSVIAAGFWLLFRDQESPLAWAAMIAGWLLLTVIIVLRTRYHKRRMSEPI
ncbi:MAG TPA: hypothetical protein VFR60_06445 [Sphingomicrobium sp.]|nr:hypothetical protein [Sphingomicrobium sp.]